MKCSNRGNEMEKGNLHGHGSSWGKGVTSQLVRSFNLAGKNAVSAYKCPACGKVDLYAEK